MSVEADQKMIMALTNQLCNVVRDQKEQWLEDKNLPEGVMPFDENSKRPACFFLKNHL